MVTVPSCMPPAIIPISPAKELHAILEKLTGDFVENTKLNKIYLLLLKFNKFSKEGFQR